mmetsp:Transcript_9875/g.21936  ORF Transcript_9875/g.21936 Transcript_9875/m.21936 type:complete len:142 (+) Transcript_9875:204-629(+)
MKANFLRVREILINEFPGQWSSIEGENYPAPEWTKLAGSVVSALQIFVMVLVMVGDSIWSYIPGFRRGPPEVYYKLKDNPALALIGVFLIIPSYIQSFANTGAFEIMLDGKVIFSKLESGRMPNVAEIIKAVESAGLHRGR